MSDVLRSFGHALVVFGGHVCRAATTGVEESKFYQHFEQVIDALWTLDKAVIFKSLDALTATLEEAVMNEAEFLNAKEATVLLKWFAAAARDLDRLLAAIEDVPQDELQREQLSFMGLNSTVFMIALAGRLFVNDQSQINRGADLMVAALKSDSDVAIRAAVRMCRDLALVTSGATSMTELAEWYDVEFIAQEVATLAEFLEVDSGELAEVVDFVLTTTDQQILRVWEHDRVKESLILAAMATSGVLLHMTDVRPVVDVFIRAMPFALSGWAEEGTLLGSA
jgi:hypothetical protein